MFLLVYSVDSKESWEEVVRLREQILDTKMSASVTSVPAAKKKGLPAPKVPMMIAGNKSDLSPS